MKEHLLGFMMIRMVAIQNNSELTLLHFNCFVQPVLVHLEEIHSARQMLAKLYTSSNRILAVGHSGSEELSF